MYAIEASDAATCASNTSTLADAPQTSKQTDVGPKMLHIRIPRLFGCMSIYIIIAEWCELFGEKITRRI